MQQDDELKEMLHFETIQIRATKLTTVEKTILDCAETISHLPIAKHRDSITKLVSSLQHMRVANMERIQKNLTQSDSIQSTDIQNKARSTLFIRLILVICFIYNINFTT